MIRSFKATESSCGVTPPEGETGKVQNEWLGQTESSYGTRAPEAETGKSQNWKTVFLDLRLRLSKVTELSCGARRPEGEKGKVQNWP